MANITRFDPFSDVVPLFGGENFWRFPRAGALWRAFPEEPEIKIDVTEDEKTYYVKADVPGVKKEDIHVSIEGNQVSISAEVKSAKVEKKGETVIRSERYYGKEYRGFTLGHDVDQGRAEAKYQDGVLELMLPKKEGSRAKQITVE